MSGFIKDGRQIGTSLDAVRDDHVRRYEFAAAKIAERFADKRGKIKIVDAGCGTGYGSSILAKIPNAEVLACDIDEGILEYGEQHYAAQNLKRRRIDFQQAGVPKCDAIVAFEFVEHIANAPEWLHEASRQAKLFVGSVPNQLVVPFDPAVNHRHVRHYTPEEMRHALEGAGWEVLEMLGQKGKRQAHAKVKHKHVQDGRTLIFVAKPA